MSRNRRKRKSKKKKKKIPEGVVTLMVIMSPCLVCLIGWLSVLVPLFLGQVELSDKILRFIFRVFPFLDYNFPALGVTLVLAMIGGLVFGGLLGVPLDGGGNGSTTFVDRQSLKTQRQILNELKRIKK